MRAVAAAGAIGLACVAGWMGWSGGTARVEPLHATVTVRPSSVVVRDAAGADVAAADAARPDPTAAVDRLWTTGSLRGTELDGDWGRWAGDTLQPGLALRRRFDQLLSARGEVDLPALRAWVAQQVRSAHGDAGMAQVLAVWDRYVQLQQTAYDQRLDVAKPATWQAALAEHSRVRRQVLGSAWAAAFYADEEREFAAMASARSSPAPSASPRPLVDDEERALGAAGDDLPPDRLQAARVAAYGADAAERLRANDTAWADWQRRVDAAKSAWAALATAPELSGPQRSEAQERLLLERFSADERARARALVTPIPPG